MVAVALSCRRLALDHAVLGSLLSGIATPTETASVGAGPRDECWRRCAGGTVVQVVCARATIATATIPRWSSSSCLAHRSSRSLFR